MKIFKSISAWICYRQTQLTQKRIGFVPTMGNLHDGHMSLIKQSIADNEITVLSIFVNPTQFNHREDLINYPRTLENDRQLAQHIGVDYLLLPNEAELYPHKYHFKVSENNFSQKMEGQFRPGHFDGVLTVVLKLLQIVKPAKAYFGEKDYQQLQLVKQMIEAFFLETEIISCETVRNASGLPFSSRHSRLAEIEWQQAQCFPKLLHRKDLSCEDIQTQLEQVGFVVEYVEEHANRRFAAVKIGNIRLIDNIAL